MPRSRSAGPCGDLVDVLQEAVHVHDLHVLHRPGDGAEVHRGRGRPPPHRSQLNQAPDLRRTEQSSNHLGSLQMLWHVIAHICKRFHRYLDQGSTPSTAGFVMIVVALSPFPPSASFNYETLTYLCVQLCEAQGEFSSLCASPVHIGARLPPGRLTHLAAVLPELFLVHLAVHRRREQASGTLCGRLGTPHREGSPVPLCVRVPCCCSVGCLPSYAHQRFGYGSGPPHKILP